MSLALQLHLLMMIKYPIFSVDNFNTFCVMGYIKILQDNDDSDINDNDPAITIAQNLLRNRGKWSSLK